MRAFPDRRTVIAALAGGVAASVLAPRAARAAARLEDDGTYVEDWYLDSFLDITEDARDAASRGKRFAVQWGMRGCPACKRLHTAYFANPEIEKAVRDRFDVVHMNTFGSREATDVDGEKLGEKALAAKRAIRTTPTFQFFAVEGDAVREVARMPGLLGEREFVQMFRFVDEGGWARTTFPDWLKTQGAG